LDNMTNRRKNILKLFIRVVGTIVLLAWVFGKLDFQQLGTVIKTAKWEFLIGVWLLKIAAFWVRSIKMRLILRKQACQVNTAKVFAASAMTALYSLVLPGALDTGVKWYILKKHTGKGSNVLSSMIYNHFSEIVVTIIAALLALMISNPSKYRRLLVLCGTILFILTAICTLLFSQRAGKTIKKYLTYVLKPFPSAIRQSGGKMLEQISVFQTVGPSFHLVMTLFCLAHILINAAIFFFAARTADITIPLVTIIWLFAAIYLLSKLPITLAGFGVREATLIESLALYGVSAPAAFLMSMVIFSNTILMAVIGAICQISWTSQTRQKISNK